jgi:hypothetical protein
MNIYDRIINMLLEARIEEYIERLDEATPMSRSARVEKIAGRWRDPVPQEQNN